MRGFMLVLMLVLLTGCASLGGGAPQGAEALIQFTRDDLDAGLAIATANADQAAINCASELRRHLPKDGTVAITPKGPFSVYVAGRQALRRLDRGIDEAVHIACAPLVLDLEKRVIRLGIMLLPGGGLAGRLLR